MYVGPVAAQLASAIENEDDEAWRAIWRAVVAVVVVGLVRRPAPLPSASVSTTSTWSFCSVGRRAVGLPRRSVVLGGEELQRRRARTRRGPCPLVQVGGVIDRAPCRWSRDVGCAVTRRALALELEKDRLLRARDTASPDVAAHRLCGSPAFCRPPLRPRAGLGAGVVGRPALSSSFCLGRRRFFRRLRVLLFLARPHIFASVLLLSANREKSCCDKTGRCHAAQSPSPFSSLRSGPPRQRAPRRPWSPAAFAAAKSPGLLGIRATPTPSTRRSTARACSRACRAARPGSRSCCRPSARTSSTASSPPRRRPISCWCARSRRRKPRSGAPATAAATSRAPSRRRWARAPPSATAPPAAFSTPASKTEPAPRTSTSRSTPARPGRPPRSICPASSSARWCSCPAGGSSSACATARAACAARTTRAPSTTATTTARTGRCRPAPVAPQSPASPSTAPTRSSRSPPPAPPRRSSPAPTASPGPRAPPPRAAIKAARSAITPRPTRSS